MESPLRRCTTEFPQKLKKFGFSHFQVMELSLEHRGDWG
jgi:hypothetical protein